MRINQNAGKGGGESVFTSCGVVRLRMSFADFGASVAKVRDVVERRRMDFVNVNFHILEIGFWFPISPRGFLPLATTATS